MERTGKCLCGALALTAHDVDDKVAACHCGMCLRWAGGPWMGVTVGSIDFEDDSALGVVASSVWAERGFCTKCGSSVFYRVTAEGTFEGLTSVSFGLLDDKSGLSFDKEWFIDRKPECYAFAGERPQVTEAEVLSIFTDLGA